MKCISILTVSVLVASAQLFFVQSDGSNRRSLDDTGFSQQINLHSETVSLQQVTFSFAVGRLVDSNWGQLRVDSAKLLNITGNKCGYINVFVSDS